MLSSRMSANSTDTKQSRRRFVAGHHADEQKEQKAKNASKESKTYVCKEKLEADVKSLQFFMRPTFD
ncbi:hypothetical protein EDM54_11930 [Brevibacillus borstelensis]|uniref:Uncharacterized protein n=1 Tax=Brevibacillus borstelensis AK1 TaxID=1300222 RepID=M8E5U7_9BACL|nr:hypothetical protein I532_03340 [Brevibacillus borstelensis AK1]RNB62902.1 hypothetical protein EDM54_11930 [Brevibacillus borstelensis]GED54089.1 hypothetical protein BBO01nite_33300 [Brevibacillus borstelensis]